MAQTSTTGLKTSGRKGKAILRLNDDDADYEDLNDGNADATDDLENAYQQNEDQNKDHREHHEDHRVHNEDHREQHENHREHGDTHDNLEKNYGKLEDNLNNQHDLSNQEQSSPSHSPTPNPTKSFGLNHDILGKPSLSAQSSTDDLGNNLYGGSLLLSQSTGLTRKFDNRKGKTEGYAFMNTPSNQSSATESGNPESLNGISFKANPIDGSIAEPVTTNKNVIPNNSYQPNQTIFNNLQRTNSQYMSSKRQQQTAQRQPRAVSGLATDEGVNNFSNFLGKSHDSMEAPGSPTNIKTRAQQRLWLQRENSLLDVSNMDPSKVNFSNLSLNNLMFAHHYNNGMAKDPTTPAAQQSLLYFSANHNTPQGQGAQTSLQQQLQNATIGNRVASAGTPRGDASVSSNSINGLFLMLQSNNSIQLRTEFERMNREYLNVRRNSNPVGETLSRIGKYFDATGAHGGNREIEVHKRGKRTGSPSGSLISSGNNFQDVSKLYTEKELEMNMTINRLWQEAASTIACPQNPANNVPRNQVPHQNNSQQQLQQPHQQPLRPGNPRLASYGQTTHMRSPLTPSTRAVKLQAQKRVET